jgi:hypothetical protein
LLVDFALVLILVPIIAFSRIAFEKAIVPQESTQNESRFFLPRPSAVKLMSLGLDQILADFFWLAFVQYVGDKYERKRDGYSCALKYIELISALDPQFVNIYFYAAFLIGSEQHHPENAAKIIDHGIHENPDNWCLPFIAGINQYLYAHDEVKAAKYYRMAAKFSDSPRWLSRQADILEAKIPSTIKEVNVWDSIYYSSTDPVIQDRAHTKLTSLWLRVYKTAPSEEIQKRALEQLHKIGIDEPSQ